MRKSGSRRLLNNARNLLRGGTSRKRPHGMAGSRLLPVERLEDRMLLTVNTSGSEFHVNVTTEGRQETDIEAPGSVAMSSTGSFVVTWSSDSNTQDTDGFGVFYRRYGASGLPIGGEQRANTVTTGNQTHANVAMDAAGNFVVVWQSDQNGNFDIYAQRYTASGSPRGGVIAVNSPSTADQILPNVSMNDSGEFVVTWSSFVDTGLGYNVRAQKFDTNGNKLGNEIAVNTYVTSDQWFSRAAIANDGRFVISWSSFGEEAVLDPTVTSPAHGIFARTFESQPSSGSGNIPAITGEIQVNVAFKRLNQVNSYVDILDSDDEFIVTWNSFRSAPVESDIFARRFMINGTAIDAQEFQVNEPNFNNQTNPTVAYDQYGEFVITWTSEFQDGSLDGVFGRRFAADAVAQGNEFQVNTFTTNDQNDATVAARPNGNFVVTWTSNNQIVVPANDPLTGVFGQLYTITRATAVNGSFTTLAGIPIDINIPSLVTPPAGKSLDLSSVIIVTPPANGTTLVDTVSGFVTYTPNPGFTGVDTFQYRMLDDEGTSSNIATVTIHVDPNANPIAFDINLTIPKNTIAMIDILANATDPDGGMLDPASIMTMNGPSNGIISLNTTTGVITYTPFFNFIGTDSFKYTIADMAGNVSNVATVTILIEGVAPTAVNDPRTTPEDVAIMIDVLANDIPGDAPLAPTTVSVVPGSGPAHGTAMVNLTTGVVTYTPALNYFGMDSFRYTVMDTLGQTSNEATVSITITSVPDNPIAVNDPVTGAFKMNNNDPPLVLNVLGNDSDPDGDTITVSMLTTPANGTAVLNPTTQEVTYTPNPGTSGIDTFTYKAMDSTGRLSNVATVRIDVNSPPQANFDGVNTTLEDTPFTINILANDMDGDGFLVPASVNIILTDAVLGTTKGKVTFDPITELATYTPPENFNGFDFFRYTVDDDDGATSNEALVLINVTAVNDPPVAVDEDLVVTDNNVAVDIPVLANDFDVDNAIVPSTVTVTDGPAHGATSVDPLTGVVTYTPDLDFDGFDEFKYTVKDASGATSNKATVPIRVGVRASISGAVYIAGSGFPLPGVMIMLTRTDGVVFTETVATDANGEYTFDEISAGTYRITQTQPALFSDGPEVNGTPPAGTVLNDEFVDVVIPSDLDAVGYDFTEAGFLPGFFLTPLGQNLLTAQGASTLADVLNGTLVTGVTLVDGSYVFSFDAGWEGLRTFEADFNGGSATLRMFDSDFNNVATAFPSGGKATLNWTATPGEPVFLQLSGTSTDVDLTVTDPNAPVVNQPPVLNEIGNWQLNEGGTLSFTASAFDPDVGETPLYFLGFGAPAGATIDPITGQFQWTTTDSFSSPVPITILAVDSPTPTQWDTETIEVTVNNLAPAAGVTGVTSGTTNQPYTFTLSAIDVSPDDQAAGFTYEIDWNGDGTVDQTVAGPGVVQVQHSFTNDGNHQVSVVAIDDDGGASAPATHDVSIDGLPQVVEVLVSGTSWSQDLVEGMEEAGLGSGGYSIPVGSSEQLRSLPWTGVDQISIVFNEDVTVAEGDLTILGANVPVYTIAAGGFSYDSTSKTATWTLAEAVSADTILLQLSDAVQDATGHALDGNWIDTVSTFASGDGSEGGEFTFLFNVLPGDINGNHNVNIDDFTLWNDTFMATPDVPGAAYADVNVNGMVDIDDFTIWVDHFNMSTPPVAPSIPESGGGGGASTMESSAMDSSAIESSVIDSPLTSSIEDDLWEDWDSREVVIAPVAAASASAKKSAPTVFDADETHPTIGDDEIGWLILRLQDDAGEDEEADEF